MYFEINRNCTLGVRPVGNSRTPVIVIDDFAVSTEPMQEYACSGLPYGPDASSLYPGLRAGLPREYVRGVLDQVFPLLYRIYGVPENLGMKPVNAVFSVISTPEPELEPRQCAPHFDSTRPFYLALLHYLNPAPHCDTGLFRHRETGLERVSADTVEPYIAAREAWLQRNGPQPPGYIKGSDAQFELYDRVEYRPNRLAVYPGSLLHSGLVDPAVDIDPDPRSGRLTANIFVDFFPLGEAA